MSGYYKKALWEEEGGYEGQARDNPDQSMLQRNSLFCF